jgi:hypothetical protein
MVTKPGTSAGLFDASFWLHKGAANQIEGITINVAATHKPRIRFL